MQKGKTESDSKSGVKENKTLDIRNRRYEDDFHGMVRHLSSSKKKDTFVYQLDTELRFDSVSQQQKSIPVSNHQEMENKKQMKKVQKEGLELFTKKNIDYGDAFAKYGVIGVLMRIEDKLNRSMSITKNGVNLINDEGIRDTLIDLHNYAAMALMLLDE